MSDAAIPDADEARHQHAAHEEWIFTAWTADGNLGVISGHRIVGPRAWYWAALARVGRPLLHITDFDVVVRAADPFIVKGEAMWAEHTCESPHHQWTIGNETYAAALDEADDALGRGYGDPTPIAWDLEWYGTEPVEPMSATDSGPVGYHQRGVVHGTIEILGEPPVELVEIAAHRWHRWTEEPSVTLEPMRLPAVVAHTGVRAPFRFPDDNVIDWVLTSHGWRERAVPDRGEASGQKSAPTP